MAEPVQPESADPRDAGNLNWGEPATLVSANIVAVVPGPYDVVLHFGREDHSHSVGGQPARCETTRVNMSWGHLKSMVPLLANAVAAYEERYGQIPSPGFDQMWKGPE